MNHQNKSEPVILGIESSCDDTAAAVMHGGHILSNVTAAQVAHREYGGVVPELASREHEVHILPVVRSALEKASVSLSELDAIGFTRGPGLLGSLLVGTSFAKGLALSLRIPLIDVHHMQAHILSHFIEEPRPAFPFLCMTVSGGHTQIVKVTSPNDFEVLGTTLDDAAGEAFDKAGKMLGLPYPAGPVIDKRARDGKPVYSFPKPNVPNLDFSFSGLKTAIKYFIRDETARSETFIEDNLADICCSVQTTIVRILLDKMIAASEQTGIREIGVAGGVSANSSLREAFQLAANERGWNVFIPKLEYCTDNAAMIAMAAHFKYLAGDFADLSAEASARIPM